MNLYQPDTLVDAENCLGNFFEVPAPRVQSILAWGYFGLFCVLLIVALASNDLVYFQGILLMMMFGPSMAAAGEIGFYHLRGYLLFLSYGALASCYAYAVMLRRPSLPWSERFYTYYLIFANLAFMFPLLFIFSNVFDEKSWLKICCLWALEKHG